MSAHLSARWVCEVASGACARRAEAAGDGGVDVATLRTKRTRGEVAAVRTGKRREKEERQGREK